MGSANPQPVRNAGNAGAQSQAGSASLQAARASSPQVGTPLGIPGIVPQRGENRLEDPKLKWVINVSIKPLTQSQGPS